VAAIGSSQAGKGVDTVTVLYAIAGSRAAASVVVVGRAGSLRLRLISSAIDMV
jgi:hypothetical protein